MLTVIAVLLLLAAVFLDAFLLAKNKNKREKWFAGLCFGIGFGILALYSTGVSVYGPTQWVMEAAKLLALVPA